MIQATFAGETFLVLTVTHPDSSLCARWVRRAYRLLSERRPAHILSIRPTLDSLCIELSDTAAVEVLVKELTDLEKEDVRPEQGEILRVPVCYAEELAPDLSAVSARTGIAVPEIIRLHSAPVYEVWMLGFMPGFPYLGRVDDRLMLPRKDRPSPRIAAGSVAVAEEYTGVYPFDSPGGWHVVGRTPWTVTDYGRTPPWLFDYGMKVQFYPITIEEYRQSASATKS